MRPLINRWGRKSKFLCIAKIYSMKHHGGRKTTTPPPHVSYFSTFRFPNFFTKKCQITVVKKFVKIKLSESALIRLNGLLVLLLFNIPIQICSDFTIFLPKKVKSQLLKNYKQKARFLFEF